MNGNAVEGEEINENIEFNNVIHKVTCIIHFITLIFDTFMNIIFFRLIK